MPETIFPFVSSCVKGPLGVMHLARVWAKVLLHACGRLPEGYRHGAGGLDEFMTTALGIDREAFVRFIETTKPKYLELEAWVREHATNLNAESIEAVNARVQNVELPEAMRAERFARLGITDPPSVKSLLLNDLDDWAGFHETLTRA